MNTITDEYRALNRELHERRPDYGVSGQKWAGMVAQLVQTTGAVTVLDYGCGKQTLAKAIPHLLIKGYDPAVPGLDEPPEPADFVTCTDVMEHIEPDLLDNVLDDLKRLTLKGIFMTIATRPAAKTLADGRNAHLIQQPATWWLPKIMDRWDMKLFQDSGGEFAVFCTARSVQ